MPVPDGPQFMKARELVGLYAYEFPDKGVSNTWTWPTRAYKDVPGAIEGMIENSKAEESLSVDEENEPYSNLYDNIKAHGVRKRVTVRENEQGQQMLMDGHHRVASAFDIDPDMDIPVYLERR